MESWTGAAIRHLAQQPVSGYARGAVPATEPTALSAMALLQAGQLGPAVQALEWLADHQAPEGFLSVRPAVDQHPRWPTSLAILAWQWHDRTAAQPRYQEQMERAAGWTETLYGETIDRRRKPGAERVLGHDLTLAAWPWVVGTHSWVEPTSLHLLALRSIGRDDQPRCQEARALLLNRQLPGGGWNYGNTTVLGQVLRPHAQPTGVTLLALARYQCDAQVARSVAWLQGELPRVRTATSLAWSLLGLAAQDLEVSLPSKDLANCFDQVMRRGGDPGKVALLTLAADPAAAPFLKMLQPPVGVEAGHE